MASINVPEISTGDVVQVISDYYYKMIIRGIPCKDVRPIMLFGPTGVGKSSAIYQIVDELEEQIDKSFHVVDIRLTSCTVTDLMGIPAANMDRTATVWLRPDIYDVADSDDYYIYFFDELDKASPSVQAAALQLILDRRAWTHEFPPNTFVIAAANPARGVGENQTKMAPELMNRFKHFNVQPDYDSFKEWGEKVNVHPYVLGYLSYDRSSLYSNSESAEVAFPTPRSWKSVSDTLHAFEGDFESVSDLHYNIAGEIGTGAALEFEGWCEVYNFIPSVERIAVGKETNLPGAPDVISALISSILTFIKKHGKTIKPAYLRNLCVYAGRFPEDYQMLFYIELRGIKDVATKLMGIPEYCDWMKEHGDAM